MPTPCPFATFAPDAIDLALTNNVLKFGEFELKFESVRTFLMLFLATGEMLSLLANGYADALAKQMKATHGKSDELVIFGGGGGIPFVAATAQALWNNHDINAHWGYNRKEAKTHGEGGNWLGRTWQAKRCGCWTM